MGLRVGGPGCGVSGRSASALPGVLRLCPRPRRVVMSNHGVFVPLVTPLDDTGAVCRQSVRQLVACSHAIASGYLPCLTSGEGWLLSQRQWEAMVGCTLEVAPRGSVIVGIERPTTRDV